MESLNLSKLVLEQSFLELLNEEDIHFDAIYTDNKELAKNENVSNIQGYLADFFPWINKDQKILLILDKLGISDVLEYLNDFRSVCILSCFSWGASFIKKLNPEIEHLEKEGLERFEIHYPWDLDSFLKALKKGGNIFIPLSNQEIPENIYASSNDEEEWVAFIDKSLIDKKNILSLLSPEKADLCLFWMWNHFEELVKLSQLLAMREERISLHVLSQWDLLFLDETKAYFSDAKKVWIILDHLPSEELQKKVKSLWKEVVFYTPHYEKLRSIFAEYQFEETDFNAMSLFERILNSL